MQELQHQEQRCHYDLQLLDELLPQAIVCIDGVHLPLQHAVRYAARHDINPGVRRQLDLDDPHEPGLVRGDRQDRVAVARRG